MLIAVTTRDNRQVLVLGLQEKNVERLLNDEPIYKNMQQQEVIGLEDWDIVILGPEDTVRFIAEHRLGEI